MGQAQVADGCGRRSLPFYFQAAYLSARGSLKRINPAKLLTPQTPTMPNKYKTAFSKTARLRRTKHIATASSSSPAQTHTKIPHQTFSYLAFHPKPSRQPETTHSPLKATITASISLHPLPNAFTSLQFIYKTPKFRHPCPPVYGQHFHPRQPEKPKQTFSTPHRLSGCLSQPPPHYEP